VPADHGVWLDNDKHIRPARPEPGKHEPEGAVTFVQARAGRGALEVGQLLAQGEVFDCEVRAAAEGGAQRSKEAEEQGTHPCDYARWRGMATRPTVHHRHRGKTHVADDVVANHRTIGSSMRMYRANAAIPPAQHARRVEVPSGFSLFPGDIVRPPRAWLERTANVVRVTEPARGGHFAPFEEPEIHAEELRAFFRPYRAAATG